MEISNFHAVVCAQRMGSPPVRGDSVIVMKDGEIVERGDPQQILSNPQQPYTKQLVNSIPSLVPKSLRRETIENMA